MIGIVLVTHGDLGKAFINAAAHILGEKPKSVIEVSTDEDLYHRGMRQRIINACREVNDGSGVLVFADIFGGSPANICSEFIDDLNISALAGVNLPLLLRAINHREEMNLAQLINILIAEQEYIVHKLGKIEGSNNLSNRSKYVECH